MTIPFPSLCRLSWYQGGVINQVVGEFYSLKNLYHLIQYESYENETIHDIKVTSLHTQEKIEVY